jgi:hypothetical protein
MYQSRNFNRGGSRFPCQQQSRATDWPCTSHFAKTDHCNRAAACDRIFETILRVTSVTACNGGLDTWQHEKCSRKTTKYIHTVSPWSSMRAVIYVFIVYTRSPTLEIFFLWNWLCLPSRQPIRKKSATFRSRAVHLTRDGVRQSRRN